MSFSIELPVTLTTHTEPGQTSSRDRYGAPTEPDSEPRVTIERAEVDHPAICAQVPGWSRLAPTQGGWHFFRPHPTKEMRPVWTDAQEQLIDGSQCLWVKFAMLKKQYPDCQWSPILAPGSPVPVTLNREHCGQQWADWERELESQKPNL